MGVLNIQPVAGGFVAGLTNRRSTVRGGIGLGRQSIGRCRMAACATCCKRHVSVKFGRQPRGILVAGTAIRCCGDMVALLARCTGSIVAARTIGGAGEGAVVCLGSGPDRGRFVAALATRRG